MEQVAQVDGDGRDAPIRIDKRCCGFASGNERDWLRERSLVQWRVAELAGVRLTQGKGPQTTLPTVVCSRLAGPGTDHATEDATGSQQRKNAVPMPINIAGVGVRVGAVHSRGGAMDTTAPYGKLLPRRSRKFALNHPDFISK